MYARNHRILTQLMHELATPINNVKGVESGNGLQLVVMPQTVMLLICIWKVPGSNQGRGRLR
jgi:hypothetical protein